MTKLVKFILYLGHKTSKEDKPSEQPIITYFPTTPLSYVLRSSYYTQRKTSYRRYIISIAVIITASLHSMCILFRLSSNELIGDTV